MGEAKWVREVVDNVNSVAMFWWNHQEQALEAMFPGMRQEYLEEFRGMSFDEMWQRLDFEAKQRLAKAAMKFYEGE